MNATVGGLAVDPSDPEFPLQQIPPPLLVSKYKLRPLPFVSDIKLYDIPPEELISHPKAPFICVSVTIDSGLKVVI